MLSILNSLTEYFNLINNMMPNSKKVKTPEKRPIYVLYEGNVLGIYIYPLRR